MVPGGIVGMVLRGPYATRTVDPADANGQFEECEFRLLGLELLATPVARAFCSGMSDVIEKVADATMGLWVLPATEFEGWICPSTRRLPARGRRPRRPA